MVTKSILIIFILAVSGCFPLRNISLDQYTKAMEQVDKGVLALRSSQLEEAEASFRVAFELAGLAQAVDGLGCIALIRGDLTTAEHYFNRAYEMDYEYNASLHHLALVYELRGELQRADSMYNIALELEPENFRARNNFAVFVSHANPREALQELRRAQVLAAHPTIEENIKRIATYEYQ